MLPNAWDAPTARAVAAAGFRAVATASGGVARALGYEDHEDAPPAGAGEETQRELVPEGLRRARAYLAAGADCVYPIALRDAEALRTFVAEAGGPVNALALPRAPSLGSLAEMGVARVSDGGLLHRGAMEHVAASLAAEAGLTPQ